MKNPVMKAQLLSAVDAEVRRLEDEASEAARAALLDSDRRNAALLILGKLTYMQEVRRHLNRPVKE